MLGQRSSKEIVRTGCDKAIITALFTHLPSEVEAKLDELGFDHEDDEITVTREISSDGGSVARINDRTASVGLLREIGSLLINIHGQHDNQILLDSERHLQILDDFDGDDTLLSAYRASFRRLQQTARTLGELKKKEQSRLERSRTLNEIIDDLGELGLTAGEDDDLEREYQAAKDSEKAIIAINNAVSAITGEGTANELLASAEGELSGFTESNKSLAALYERLSAAEIELADIASELEHAAGKIELDGQRLDEIAERLGTINKLKRKYATDCEGLVKLYDDACAEMSALDGCGDEIAELVKEREQLLHEVTEQAKALFNYREEASARFTERVTAELAFLNMEGVIIEVRHEKGKLTVNGMDSVEFLISANKGEEPKPISKIASGGELSRIMLALKSVIADKDSIPTMIFDEIDTGVSGKAAQKIGIKLRQIGKVRQVICVTHLSQIAVMADDHLMIEKNVVGDRTETSVTHLDLDGRIAEIARIMGGDQPSALMLENAEAEIRRAAEL